MKTSIPVQVITYTILLLLPGTLRGQDNPALLFEQARMLDENNKDLGEAITLYMQVADEAEQRALSAEAQLRVGFLYERLGRDQDAQNAYKVVVSDYSDQEGVVREAQTRIQAHAAGKTEMQGVVVTQIWAGENVDILGAPSSDGRYLSFVDWTTGDLAIRDLETEGNRRLTNKGDWTRNLEYAEYSTISPDGELVAYSWFEPKSGLHDLRISSMDGSQQRVVFHDDEVHYIQPETWSSDGSEILVLLTTHDRTNEIAMIRAADGSKRVLRSLGWRQPWKLSLSPDDRYVAYDLPSSEDQSDRDIYLVSTAGGGTTRLVQHPADDLFPIWSADGGTILFVSDRTGTADVWAVEVVDSAPAGSARLVKRNIGPRALPMGLTRDGTLFYGLLTGMSDVYVATLDVASGEVMSSPTKVAQRFEGLNDSPEWSPDGSMLAMVRTSSPTPIGLGPSTISIWSPNDDGQRQVDPGLSRLGYYSSIRWSPDGKSFLTFSEDHQNRPGLYRIEVESGDVAPIMHVDPEVHIADPTWFPDGSAILFVRADHRSGTQFIVKRELETNVETVVYQTDSSQLFIRHTALSPDGALVSFVEENHTDGSRALKLASVETLTLSTLSTPEDELISHSTGLTWTPDGRQILFGTYASENKMALWKVPAKGGAAERIDLAMPGLGDLRFHPDGQRIAFVAGSYSAEVWTMQNFEGEPSGQYED